MSEEVENPAVEESVVPQNEQQTIDVEDTLALENTEGEKQENSIDFKALKDKYLGFGKKQATKDIQQQLIDAKIFNEEGQMTPELADYLQNQQFGSDHQNAGMDNNPNTQYVTPDKLDAALRFREDQKNIESTAISGEQKYGEKWPEIAKVFVEDAKVDPDALGVVQAVTGRQNGHEILDYLNRNPLEYEKFKGMKPRLLNLTLNNLAKNLSGKTSDFPVDPLVQSKASTQATSNGKLSKYELMMQKKKEFKVI